MTDFEIVPNEERPAGYAGGVPSQLALALEAGQTAFVTHESTVHVAGQAGGYLAKRGYKVRQRKGERNGSVGWYAWAEKRP